MKIFHLWIFLSFFLFSCCCSKSSLRVQTDYLTHKDLASYHVGTPDPRQNITAIGQRLIIGWAVPKSYLSYENLRLEITIRFRNREELLEVFHLSKTRGTYVFSLLNQDYLIKQGILTYKINLIGENEILEEWRHQIWVDLISIDHTEGCQLAAPQKENETEEKEEEYSIDWD